MASPGTPRVLSRWHSSVYVSEGQAAVELFFRLNHARQTMDYVRHQVAPCSCLGHMLPCQAGCSSVPFRQAVAMLAARLCQHLLPIVLGATVE